MSNSKKQNTVKKSAAPRALKSHGAGHMFKNSDTSLARYFRNIGRHNTLDADEEMAQAREIFELEEHLWTAILENREQVKIVKDIVREAAGDDVSEAFDEVVSLVTKLDRSLARTKSSKRRTASTTEAMATLAEKLRDLDEDRSLVGQVLSRMKAGAEGGRLDVTINGLTERVKHVKHRFIRENLGLVVNIAKRYHVDQMSLSDLIQEGNLGLMRAVDKFDYRKGFRFSTYASWWIRSYISRAIVRKSNTVRIPEYMLRDRNRIKRTDEAHRAKAGRSLNEEELASELGLSKKRLQRTLRHDVAFIESLDREMPGNDHQKYIDFLSDENAKSPLEMASLNDWLKSIPQTLEHLSVVERFVICWRFGLVDGDEMTLQEIGQCLSLSRERIRQIQEEALGKLRDRLEVSAA